MRIALLFWFFFTLACVKRAPEPPKTPVEEGQALYMRHCVACHSPDPRNGGALGPALHASSLELLERKLVHGDYPPGYKPKRSTQAMTRLPFLKDSIPALHAYLNSP